MSYQGEWRPFTAPRPDPWTWSRPREGEVLGYRHAAWQVLHVADAILSDEEEAWLAERANLRVEAAPYYITLRRLHGPAHRGESDLEPGRLSLRTRCGLSQPWTVYPGGRVPLCSCCGDPWPCRMLEAEQEAQAEGQRLNELSQRVENGACFACGQPVTSRQKTIVYPENNVRVPLGPPPVFHARRSCRLAVVEYEGLRAKVLPEAAPMVDVRTHAVIRDNDGRLVEHHPESFHAAWRRAIELGEIDEEGRDPATGSRWASASDGRRDMWRSGGTRPCFCGRGPKAYVGGNRAQGLTSGCKACMAEWVEHGYRR